MVKLLTQVKFVQGLTAVDAETLTAEQALAMAISLSRARVLRRSRSVQCDA